MKRILLLSILILGALPAIASDESRVSWHVSSRHIGGAQHEIVLEAEIAAGWHMYDAADYGETGPNPTALTIRRIEGARPEGALEAQGNVIKVHDPTFDMEIGYFEGTARFVQRVVLTAPEAAIDGTVEWMLCDDTSCTPPDDYDFELTIRGDEYETPVPGSGSGSGSTPASALSPTPPATPSGNIWNNMLAAILWGFAALLTPCVFPMVPMTISFFLKSSKSKAQGKFHASLFGFFIVALYTLPILGIILITNIVGGQSVTADMFNWLATHWLPNVIFFLVFMIFAASFFGAFEIVLPSWMISRSDEKADKGGLVGIFFMALTLVLVSFSCTGPIVGSVLIKSTTGGGVWDPVFTMLAFSLAFAVPFTLLALFPSWMKELPKSGGWLNSVKVTLGFLEVALGLKFLSVADQTYHWGILPRELYLAIWVVVFAMLGFYLLGKIRFRHDDELKYVSVGRLFFSIVVFTFTLRLLSGMFGVSDLRGISGYLPPRTAYGSVSAPAAAQTDFPAVRYGDLLHLPHGLRGFFDLDEGLEYARSAGKPVLVDFTGHGCVNCREMEERVWSAPEVLSLLRDEFVIIALYSDDKKNVPQENWIVTDNGKTLKGLGKINSYIARTRFGVNAQPYYIILDGEGRQLLPPRGYDLDVAAFARFLRDGLAAFRASGE